VIDEISLLGISILNYINMLTRSDVKFIIIGDFFQLSPPCDYFCGTVVENNGFAQSRLLHTLAGGNLIQLTKCRRSSGGLFEFYTSLYPDGRLGKLPLKEMITIARKKYPRKKCNARWNLVISHTKRKLVNLQCYKNKVTGGVLEVELADELKDEIYVGCPLIGNVTDRKIVHGAFYTVLNFSDTIVRLKDLETQTEVEIPHASMKHCRYGFAITYASVQSRTLREHTRLHDWGHRCFTVKHLAMGLGRGISPLLIDLV
jgi:hypothetical protein